MGCGSSSSSPSAPSSNGSGAVINGSLTSGQAAASTQSIGIHPAAVGTGLTVTIVGTSMSTVINSSGQFTFTNVPGGNISLKFTGSGVNGEVDLDSVEPTETITLVLTMDGAAIDVDTEHRHGGSQEQLEGKVQSLPPTTAAGTFIVAGQTVMTDANTVFSAGGGTAVSFANLVIGTRVHVRGHMNGSALLATKVEIQSGAGNNGGLVQISGSMGGLKGTCPSIQFVLNGSSIFTDATTVFTSACSTLKSGTKVTVNGVTQADGTVKATMVVAQ